MFEGWNLHINGVCTICSKCELAWTVDEGPSHSTPDGSIRHTPFNLSWASNCIHKNSCKKVKEKISKFFKNKQITLANRKQFLTVQKLGGFGLIKKFRSRASICKKNQLNRSYRTQVMIKGSLNVNLNKFKIWKFQKVDVTGSLDRWKQDKTIGAGFI